MNKQFVVERQEFCQDTFDAAVADGMRAVRDAKGEDLTREEYHLAMLAAGNAVIHFAKLMARRVQRMQGHE